MPAVESLLVYLTACVVITATPGPSNLYVASRSINHIEKAMGDARHTAADVSKARKLLGYQPQVSLKEGLVQEWQWIQALYR